jgi:hypothetical protein
MVSPLAKREPPLARATAAMMAIADNAKPIGSAENQEEDPPDFPESDFL